jgi:hypothetical protein
VKVLEASVVVFVTAAVLESADQVAETGSTVTVEVVDQVVEMTVKATSPVAGIEVAGPIVALADESNPKMKSNCTPK